MLLNRKQSDFFRRLRFYGFGLLMGCLLVSIITKGRACMLPSTLKMEELSSQYLEYTKHAHCRMDCRHISEEDIKQVLKGGSVNYGKSGVHDKPFPTYTVEGATKSGKQLRIVIADCDTISRVVTAIDLGIEKDSCNCN